MDDPVGAGPRSRAARMWWLRCRWLPSGDVWRIEPTGICWLSVGSIGCRGTVVFTDTNFVEPVVVHQSTKSRQVTADQGQRSRAVEPLMDFPVQARNGQQPRTAAICRVVPTEFADDGSGTFGELGQCREFGAQRRGDGRRLGARRHRQRHHDHAAASGAGRTRRYAPPTRPGATSRR